MIHPSTPEGAAFREALSGHDAARVLVTGHRPCQCGQPGCAEQAHGVAITIDGHTALATNPEAVALIVEALRDATEFAWGKERRTR